MTKAAPQSDAGGDGEAGSPALPPRFAGHGEILVSVICGWNRSRQFVTDPVTMAKRAKPLQLQGKQYRLKFSSNSNF
jgi:hypothetical protein